MTEQDRDAIAGRTRREYREAKQQLAALRAKARSTGELLSAIGKSLIDQPESVVFSGQSIDTRFPGSSRLYEDSHFADVIPAALRNLTNDIRQTIIKAQRLRDDVAKMEGEDPEKP